MSSSKNNIAIVKGSTGRGRDYWYIVPGNPDYDKCAKSLGKLKQLKYIWDVFEITSGTFLVEGLISYEDQLKCSDGIIL